MVSYEALAALTPEDVATAVIAQLDGTDARGFGRLCAEFLALEDGNVRRAFVFELVRPALELIAHADAAPEPESEPEPYHGGRRADPEAHKEWLRTVARLWAEGGCAPSLAELAGEWHLPCRAGARWRLAQLQLQGWLTWEPKKCRTLRLTKAGYQLLEDQAA